MSAFFSGLPVDQSWLYWALAVIIGLPLFMIILDEVAQTLRHQNHLLAGPLLFVRNAVLPSLGLLILLTQILEFPLTDIPVRIAVSAVGIVCVYSALQVVNALLFQDAGQPAAWPGRIPKVVRELIRLFLVGLGAVIVLSRVWNLDVGGLFTALGVSSIVLGLALQEPLGNVFSGIALMIHRPFAVGDWISAEGSVGEVKEITLWAAIIQTPMNELKAIPNSSLAKQVIGNFSRAHNFQIQPLALVFPASIPPNQVRAALEKLAGEVPGVRQTPPPEASVTGIAGESINYVLTFSVDDYQQLEPARQRFLTRLWYASRRQRTGLPPVGTNDPNVPVSDPATIRLRLSEIALFSHLPPDVLDQLSQPAVMDVYGQGERLLSEGELSPGVLVVLAGRVCLSTRIGSQEEAELECLDRGRLLGEPTPGTPYAMTATAQFDTTVLVLDYACLSTILQYDPTLIREITQTLDAIRRGADAARRSAMMAFERQE